MNVGDRVAWTSWNGQSSETRKGVVTELHRTAAKIRSSNGRMVTVPLSELHSSAPTQAEP